jgi:hypothetical protein
MERDMCLLLIGLRQDATHVDAYLLMAACHRRWKFSLLPPPFLPSSCPPFLFLARDGRNEWIPPSCSTAVACCSVFVFCVLYLVPCMLFHASYHHAISSGPNLHPYCTPFHHNQCVQYAPSTLAHVSHVLFKLTSLRILNASLYASNSVLTLVRSATSASSSNSRSAKRSGLYSEVTRRCCIASREKSTCNRQLGPIIPVPYPP